MLSLKEHWREGVCLFGCWVQISTSFLRIIDYTFNSYSANNDRTVNINMRPGLIRWILLWTSHSRETQWLFLEGVCRCVYECEGRGRGSEGVGVVLVIRFLCWDVPSQCVYGGFNPAQACLSCSLKHHQPLVYFLISLCFFCLCEESH